MKGKLKVKGNMSLAMKFNTVLTATRKQLASKGASGGKPLGSAVCCPGDPSLLQHPPD
jgi:hypothetical protein